MDLSSSVILGQMEYQEAKRIKSLLEDEGIVIALRSDPQSCGSSCKPTVEVWVAIDDLAAVKAFLAREQARSLDGLNVDPELMNCVFDPEEEKARCPACGTEFSTQNRECPECGLVFASETGPETPETEEAG